MVVRIAGRQIYLWRAVDHEGEVLDILVQRRRDTRAALRLMRKLLKKQGFAPKLLITDKPGSYACAFRRLRLNCPHEQARDGQWVVLEAVPAPAFLHRLQCEDDALRSAEMERRGCALASAVEMRRE